MKQLIIIGARGFGREVYDLALSCIKAGADFEIKGFLDDKKDAFSDFEGYPPIISSVEDYVIQKDDVFTCAMGTPEWRKLYTEIILAKGGQFITLISPMATIRKNAHIGQGCIITHGSNISVDTYISDYTAILSSCLGHDVRIGMYSVLSGRVLLNGYVTIGDEAYLGCGAMVAPHKKIGNKAFVGIGSVVISNVKAGTKVFGNPAKKMVF